MSPSVTFDVTAPQDHQEAYQTAAAAEDQATMAWVIECCLAQLTAAQRENLSHRSTRRDSGPTKAKKRNDSNAAARFKIRVPADWRDIFDQEARKQGMKRSEWIRWCCDAHLPEAVKRELSEPRPAHRPAEQ